MSRRNIKLAIGASDSCNLKGFPQRLLILRCCKEAAAIRILRSEEFEKIQASSMIVGNVAVFAGARQSMTRADA